MLKTSQTIWKRENWAIQGAFMGNSSFVEGRVMPVLIHTNKYFDYLKKTTKNQYFLNKTAHILAYDKARIAHESSLKSSVLEFSGGLTSF